MKCYLHPKEDAVAVCKSCGKGVCSNCVIEVGGISYCKACVEAKAITLTQRETRAVPPPPNGIPSKTHFILGGVGSIISSIAAMLSLFVGGLAVIWWYFGAFYITIVSLINSIILGIGLIMAGIGYLGVSRNFKKGVATAGFAFSIIVTAFLLITVTLGLIVSYGSYYYYYYSHPWYIFYIAMVIVTLVLFGVMQILWGASHIQTRQYTVNSGLSMTTGIMFIIAGAFTISFLLSFIGFILFFTSNIMATIVFITQKT
ncbi:MAG: hypothetical protein QW840_03680 [Candidatus Bathyarchaeia archaeon]